MWHRAIQVTLGGLLGLALISSFISSEGQKTRRTWLEAGQVVDLPELGSINFFDTRGDIPAGCSLSYSERNGPIMECPNEDDYIVLHGAADYASHFPKGTTCILKLTGDNRECYECFVIDAITHPNEHTVLESTRIDGDCAPALDGEFAREMGEGFESHAEEDGTVTITTPRIDTPDSETSEIIVPRAGYAEDADIYRLRIVTFNFGAYGQMPPAVKGLRLYYGTESHPGIREPAGNEAKPYEDHIFIDPGDSGQVTRAGEAWQAAVIVPREAHYFRATLVTPCGVESAFSNEYDVRKKKVSGDGDVFNLWVR